jgi:integral membrane protein
VSDFALGYFRWLMRLEGISLLILVFIAMPLKWFFANPAAVRVVGGVHGVLFLMFFYTLLSTAAELKWRGRKILWLLLLSSLPLGFLLAKSGDFSRCGHA